MGTTEICTISQSVDNSVKELHTLPEHLTLTNYRPETAKSTRSSILVDSPNPPYDTIPGKYEAPPLEGEDYLDGPPRCSNSVKGMVAGGIILFIIIFSTGIAIDSLHTINEGNVGIYFVHGALDDRYTYPGTHWAIPFVTDVKEVTIRPVTSTMSLIRTITRDGIANTFSKVQVISDVKEAQLIPLIKKYGLEFRDALIFDRISEELRIFCANHTD